MIHFIGVILPFELPLFSPKSKKNCSVALFEVALMPLTIPTRILKKNIGWNTKEAEISILKELADILVASNVDVVASQKLIHPFLQSYLQERVQFDLIFLIN